jgi:pyrimidine-nucleoside phosphorylase
MNAVDVIIKKRDGFELNREEIEFFVTGFTRGDIPDYQAAAWAMAVLLKGMTDRETTDLTMAMASSGSTLDLSRVVKIALDKHSTGGVGDKTTLVVEPLVASCGVPVGKMSGRGLGFSGGTLDKLESIPGYRTNLSRIEFIEQLKDIGLVLTGQSPDLAPADGKFYALRDVTGTVQSMPLIAASVMSKKIAGGAQAIVLDVKVGSGAFMKTLEEARSLAVLMVSIGRLSGRKVVALLSDMNQPLGCAVGNALELKEAIETLQGEGPQDFRQHCLDVAGEMLLLGGRVGSIVEGMELAKRVLADGSAWEKFRILVQRQGGDVSYIDHPEKLPQAKVVHTIGSESSGFISRLDARVVGETSVLMGAGRVKKEDRIDHSVGILVHKKVGEGVELGEPMFTLHAASREDAKDAETRLREAFTLQDAPCQPLPLFYDRIE